MFKKDRFNSNKLIIYKILSLSYSINIYMRLYSRLNKSTLLSKKLLCLNNVGKHVVSITPQLLTYNSRRYGF